MISSSDPTPLSVVADGTGHTMQLIMEPCPLEGDMSLNSSGPGQAYLARGLSFYKLFMLQSDLSVHETIVYSQISSENEYSVENISWARIHHRRKEVRAKAGVGEFDDFLDPSGNHGTELPVSKLPLQLPARIVRTAMNAVHRVADYKLLHDALTQIQTADEAIMATIDIHTVNAQLSQLLADSSDLSQLPLGTL
jgi:RNA polymerase I-specific transcription initiation factor RRN6